MGHPKRAVRAHREDTTTIVERADAHRHHLRGVARQVRRQGHTMSEATSSRPAPGRRNRRAKNYLLDRHFQLKYAGFLVAIALILSAGLGALLWRTGDQVIEQSRESVKQGQASRAPEPGDGEAR